MTRPAPAIIASPTQPAPAARFEGNVARRPAPTARSAPIPSSQARDGREKKAHGALAEVSHSDRPNEATTTITATVPTRRRWLAPVRVTSRSRAGQNR